MIFPQVATASVPEELEIRFELNEAGGIDVNLRVPETNSEVPYSWTSSENEKCAIAEGWAWFYAGATYWTPAAYRPTVKTRLLEDDTADGNSSAEACVSWYSSPHRRIGNAARFFWDMYDSTTDGGYDPTYDSLTVSVATINDIWDAFPSGTANRKASESGDDGRNAYDFTYYGSSAYSSVRQLNCLNAQEP